MGKQPASTLKSTLVWSTSASVRQLLVISLISDSLPDDRAQQKQNLVLT